MGKIYITDEASNNSFVLLSKMTYSFIFQYVFSIFTSISIIIPL